MCHRTTCRRCGKASWAGCGAHVSQVMAAVPKADRCPGHEGEPPLPGFLGRLLGRA
ncbi:MAG: hypothetical protein HYU55_11120 [Nocardioides sp.]|nr:hypothetical protein [Nocardioides sp.]